MICELCRVDPVYSFHHFIPKTLHSNKWFKQRYTRQEMSQGADVCRECHHVIHDTVPKEKELGRNFNTREKLLEHPDIARYITWKRRRGYS